MKNKFKVIKGQAISIVILILLCAVMLFTFYQNITLKLKRQELNNYIEEYQILKEELNKLEEIKENYEIIVADNNNLEDEKTELENRIAELNNRIETLNTKIDKLK